MNVQEMETARRLNSNVVILLWEDGGYGLIAWKQETNSSAARIWPSAIPTGSN